MKGIRMFGRFKPHGFAGLKRIDIAQKHLKLNIDTQKKCHDFTEELPSRELTYPPDTAYLKMIFLFPRVGYVNSLEGNPFLNPWFF